MQIITSKDNENIKSIKKLKERKHRKEQGCYIAEGTKLVEEAIIEKCNIQKIVICEECIKNNALSKKLLYEIAKYDCIYVSEAVFNQISDVTSPQGILAVIKLEQNNREIDYNQELLLILDDVQDPGNLGTIIRTADSIGLNQIILSDKCGDVYNPKVVRSTMGAIFRIKIIKSENLTDTISKIKENNFTVASTNLKTDTTIYDISYNKTAIVIGNEANGVSSEILEKSDKQIKIPMLGKTESLNASVATSIILYEYVRQKLKK